MVRATLCACAALALWLGTNPPALAQVAAPSLSRVEPDAAALGGPPVRARQRTGVSVTEGRGEGGDADHLHAGAGGLSLRELRRLGVRPEGNGMADLGRWPPEPATPASVAPAKLAAALVELCPPTVPAPELREIADYVVTFATHFEVDPMLLGALMYHQSACTPSHRNSWGAGLTMLNRGLFPASLSRGALRYAVRGSDGAWNLRTMLYGPPLSSERGSLLDRATNLRTAAALLRMYRDQCPGIDPVFHSLPHRHYVSHFVWGDRVRGTGPEDNVLIARRRLIQYYVGFEKSAQPTATVGRLTVGSPLDGAPRIVTSGLGEARDGGRRAHAGVDFLSRMGEPVRAIADGVVSHAGSDLRDGTLVNIAPERAAIVADHAMGPRGLFVEIAHADGYRSIYAHFASYNVTPGTKVQRGQLLGYVGRTGVQESDAHLHFGLFKGTQVVDPRTALAPLLFAPLLEQREAQQHARSLRPPGAPAQAPRESARATDQRAGTLRQRRARPGAGARREPHPPSLLHPPPQLPHGGGAPRAFGSGPHPMPAGLGPTERPRRGVSANVPR